MSNSSHRLAVTRMDGPLDSACEEVDNPTWSDIEAAIRRLDGDRCTLLVIGIGDPPVPHMAIGGGEHGKYILYATRDNAVFHKLVDPKVSAGKFHLVAGGQRGEYDAKLCVTLPEVLRAAKTYAETGELDSTLSWET